MFAELSDRPLVSIITPVYNHEKYIGQCIESVLSQTYDNWEMIIVDDGSADNTGRIVKNYNNDKIIYLRQDNVGIWRLSESYNKAFKMAKGELIAVLEGDDFWPGDKLEKGIQCFKNRDVALCWGKVAIYLDGSVIATYPDKPFYFAGRSKEESTSSLLDANFVPACTAICRKEALSAIGGFRQEVYTPFVDYPTWLNLSLTGKICGIDEVMGYWRVHDKQMTAGSNLRLGADRYAIEFYNGLPSEIKKRLKIGEKKLRDNLKKHSADEDFYRGRAALRKGEWHAARACFAGSLRHGTAGRRLKSLAGILLSYCRQDFEAFAVVTGRAGK